MRKAIAGFAGLAVLFVGVGACVGAEVVDNPQYGAWAKFKPGTTITVLTVTDGGKTTMEKTSTLLSVAADKVVLEEKQLITNNGQKFTQNPFRTEVPVKIDPALSPEAYNGVHGAGDAEKPAVKESAEEVDVGGKKVKCKLVVTTYPGQGSGMVDKKWTSEEVPGGLVKSETVLSGGGVSMTTTIAVTGMSIK